ncbi:hypothetical protein [Cohnella cholangitidis]|uniref:Capsule polysaccharide biosynthesis protein n=1 Tax=Cohnella cholangitidis TaxID=2598458 RepID=A0A7G5BXI6_9BACL|nr:hypothetical protein [Cohnella cholangitidis]QMV41670.1 hypothetical protein FPL14_11110 [Cohnella cholangitidis]
MSDFGIFGKRFVFWGTGSLAKRTVEEIGQIDGGEFYDKQVCYYISGNREMAGTTFIDKKVYIPEKLTEESNVCIVILSSYIAEISEQIDRLNIKGAEVISYSQLLYFFKMCQIDHNENLSNRFEAIKRLSFEKLDYRLREIGFSVYDLEKKWILLYGNTIHGRITSQFNLLCELWGQSFDTQYSGKSIALNSYDLFYKPETIAAYIMASLGAKIYFAYDDFMKPTKFFSKFWDFSKEMLTYENYRSDSRESVLHRLLNEIDQFTVMEMFRHENIVWIPYSSIEDRYDDVRGEATVSEITSKHVFSFTKRYMQTDKLDYNDSITKRFMELAFEEAALSRRVGLHLYRVAQPDIFLTTHAIYTTWGPCYDLMAEKNVESVVYGVSAHQNNLYCISDRALQFADEGQSWNNFSKLVFEPAQSEMVDKYMSDRLQFKIHDTSYYYREVGKVQAEFDDRIQSFASGEKVFCAFPNIVWDGAEEERDVVFESVTDWLIQTIEYFRNKSEKLIVRMHPAEDTLYKGVRKVEDVLRNAIEDIDSIDNVLLISAKERLNTYEFVKKHVDVALVYNGFLGLELPYLDVPTILSGRGLFRNEAINIVANSKEDYYRLIDNYELIVSSHSKIPNESIRKYLYWYLFYETYEFPFVSVLEEESTERFKGNYFDLNENAGLKRTIDRFLGITKN